jgi:putative tricarboxylic transport membrane protein
LLILEVFKEDYVKKIVTLLTGVVVGGLLLSCQGKKTGTDATAALPKNIEVQVPAKAGGGTDVMARSVMMQIAKDSGSNISIVNNTDGSGVVAMEKVRTAKNDGSTLLQFHTTMLIKSATNVYKHLAADEFTVIAVAHPVEKVSEVLVVSAVSKYKTLDDLVSAAKAAPGTLLFGVETGGTVHLVTGMFAKAAGLNLKYVEAGSDTEKLTALVGNSIDACFVNPNQARQYVESGKVIPLATVPIDDDKSDRSSVLPDVPNMLEFGYPCTFATYFFLLGPKDMDKALVDRLYALYASASTNPDVLSIVKPAGLDMICFPQEEGRVAIQKQQFALGAVVENLGLKKK